jgi:hypothetical protein
MPDARRGQLLAVPGRLGPGTLFFLIDISPD